MTQATFKTLSLDSLLKLFATGTENLLESKIKNEAPDMTPMYQKVLDQIQHAIVIRRAEKKMLIN